VQWNQKSKKGKFDLYDIDMDIYSLQDNSPNVRLQKLQAIMKAFIVPFVDQIKQAGGTIDVQKILQLVGKYSDFPELDEIVTFVEGNANTQQGGSSSPPPAKGDSTVTRVGQPGMSRAGGERQMAQTLMGQGVTDNATEGVRTAR
jgi:hypothetical protein